MSLVYTKEHLWIDTENGKVGITDYAQGELGDILFVDLPEEDSEFSVGDKFTELETSKTTVELVLPFDGKVVKANEELDDDPENINEDAFGTWIAQFEMTSQPERVMDEAEYKAFIETL